MPTDRPQIYLITPPQFDFEPFCNTLSAVLDAQEVACLRLDMASRDGDLLLRAADTLRALTEPRDVALVIADHWKIAARAGLDGVHLGDGARHAKAARADLGADAIVGAHCGVSRHDGLTAGEMGADYVAFGPVGDAGLGADERADTELFAWWSEMIEVPVVAEGELDEERLSTLSSVTDFVAFGSEIWGAQDPVQRLGALVRAL